MSVIEAMQGAILVASGRRTPQQQIDGKLTIAKQFPRLLQMMSELYAEIGKDIAALPEEERVEYRRRLMEAKQQAQYKSNVPYDER